MQDQDSPLEKYKLGIFLFLAITSLVYLFLKINFIYIFWFTVLIWFILLIIFFIKPISRLTAFIWYFIGFVFVFTNLLAFNVIPVKSNTSNLYEKTKDGIALTTCTSTANDKPIVLEGWKSTIYSAPLLSSSPDITAANNINKFSYNGIINKTENNSMYVRIEKNDQSYITGYGTTIEACSEDNKTSLYYTAQEVDSTASENVIASVHYFHGGKYLHGAGKYRVDVYIKTLDSKWHLVDRISDIEITE